MKRTLVIAVTALGSLGLAGCSDTAEAPSAADQIAASNRVAAALNESESKYPTEGEYWSAVEAAGYWRPDMPFYESAVERCDALAGWPSALSKRTLDSTGSLTLGAAGERTERSVLTLCPDQIPNLKSALAEALRASPR